MGYGNGRGVPTTSMYYFLKLEKIVGNLERSSPKEYIVSLYTEQQQKMQLFAEISSQSGII